MSVRVSDIRNDINTAIRRLAAAYYIILENPALASELVGASISNIARVAEKYTKAAEIRRMAGAVYDYLVSMVLEMVVHERAGEPGPRPVPEELKKVREDIKSLIDRLITLYSEVKG